MPDKPLSVTFAIDEVDEQLDVRKISGTEAISQLYRFQVEFTCSSQELEFAQVVGKPARIAYEDLTKKPRYIHGVVHRLLKLGKGTRGVAYIATLVPKADQLMLGADCQLFQEKSMKQIVCELLDAAKIEHKFQASENQDPEEREYCVQYRESHWSFISRLLAEEGYAYFFAHERDKHTLHITNEPTLFPAIPAGDLMAEFYSTEIAHVTTEHVSDLYFSEEICPDKVMVRDYNFEKPAVDMKGEAPKKAPSEPLEIYDYPGDFITTERGAELAQLRLEQANAVKVEGAGHAFCPRFTAGHHFQLGNYPHEQLDPEDKYLLLSVTHHVERHDEGEGTPSSHFAYGNSFTCIPYSTPYRPQLPARPVVSGVHTAKVVGPSKDSKEEIHTDDQGRVKVLFHWDRKSREDKPAKYGSCWIRVSQIFAGPRMGAVFTPRVGDEVIVDFLEGDPDRPIITGRVFNGQNVPALDLPANKTQSTIKTATSPGGQGKGYNQIRFEDKKGSEELFVQAQKDMNETIKNCMSTSVGANQSLTVGGERTTTIKKDHTVEVTEGDETMVIKQGNRTRVVELGDDSTSVGVGKQDVNVQGDASLNVAGGNRIVNVASNYKVTAGASVSHTAGSTLQCMSGGAMQLTAGGALAVACGSGCSLIAQSMVQHSASKIGQIAGSAISQSAPKITLTGQAGITIKVGGASIKLTPAGITLKGGGGTVKIDPSGVTISGPMIKLN